MILIFFIVAVAGLFGAAIIVIPKLPRLAALDLEHLPQEKEARRKRELMEQRITKESGRLYNRLGNWLKPLQKFWGHLQLEFRKYVGKIERLWHHEQIARKRHKTTSSPEEAAIKVEKLILEGEEHLRLDRSEQAENAFIAAIKIDPRAARAYRGLGDAYIARGMWSEAGETYNFVVRLDQNDELAYIKLANIAEHQGDIQKAISYAEQAIIRNDSRAENFYYLGSLLLSVKQPEAAREALLSAVDLEPRNPRYLDLLLETVILCNDKNQAHQIYDELRLVNPDNQKLASFKERIEKR